MEVSSQTNLFAPPHNSNAFVLPDFLIATMGTASPASCCPSSHPGQHRQAELVLPSFGCQVICPSSAGGKHWLQSQQGILDQIHRMLYPCRNREANRAGNEKFEVGHYVREQDQASRGLR